MREDLAELAPFVRQMRAEEEYRRRALAEAAVRIQQTDRRFTRGQIVWGSLVGLVALGIQVTGLVIALRGGR